ncbi:MAG TPA: hypothetical protein VFV93_17625 [Thermomicrobiales bacterium]|nr:hypothetical protein [Thermomicrobiales bacterium]
MSLTFQTFEDASRAEALLASMGIRTESAPGWSTEHSHGDTASRSVAGQFGIGCAVLLGLCMLFGVISALIGNAPGTSFSSVNAVVESESSSNGSNSDYRTAIMSQSDELGRSMTRFTILSQDPQLFSDSWRIDVAAELAIWRSTYRDAIELSAPNEFRAFHTTYLAALAEFDAAADKVERGLESMDPAFLDAAADDIRQGTALIDDALAVIPD